MDGGFSGAAELFGGIFGRTRFDKIQQIFTGTFIFGRMKARSSSAKKPTR